MERHQTFSPCNGLKKPMSPCGVFIVDGFGNVIAHLIYKVDTDIGIPVVYDEAFAGLIEIWLTDKTTLDLKEKYYLCTMSDVKPDILCHTIDCLCSGETVKRVPYKWAQDRQKRLEEKHHWLDECVGSTGDQFSIGTLTHRSVPVEQIEDTGKDWRGRWSSKHGSFCRLEKAGGTADKMVDQGICRGTPKLEELPFEIFEVLTKYLDGMSLISFCDASATIEGAVLGAIAALPVNQRKVCWFKIFKNDLDRSTSCKIWSSYDGEIQLTRRLEGEEDYELVPVRRWENLFDAYRKYWRILLQADVKSTNLSRFEKKLKGEMLLHKQVKEARGREGVKPIRLTRCGGGKVLLNIAYPCPSTPLNPYNMVVMSDMEEVNKCMKSAQICNSVTLSEYFNAKIVHFPFPREQGNTRTEKDQMKASTNPEVDRVVIGVCTKCITVSSIIGTTTRRLSLEGEVYAHHQKRMEPIFEILDNVMVVWIHPTLLSFYLVKPSEGGYDLQELYRLRFPSMESIWNRLAVYRNDYIPVITTFNKKTNLMKEEPKWMVPGKTGYMFQPTEPTYYGLALVSHIYGVESFQPLESLTPNSTVVESLEPHYYSQNGRKYLPKIRETTSSAKGHGIFVFCNNTTIAVSYDCLTWIFGPLHFPACISDGADVTHVDVIYHDGIMVVADENIVLMKLTLTIPHPEYRGSLNVSEPHLEVKPMRVFRLGLMPLKMEITQLELNFDNGKPFLLIVAEKKAVKTDIHEIRDEFSFVMKRIDFISKDEEI